MKIGIILLLWGFISVVSAKVPEDWYVIKAPDQKCILAMPEEPHVFKKNIDTDWGIIKTWHCELKIDTCMYKFFIYDYPEKFTNYFTGEEIFDFMMKSISEEYDSPPIKKKIIYKEELGFEVFGVFNRNQKWAYKYRLFYVNGRIYSLYAAETNELAYRARLFLNSFEILDRTAID